MANRTLCVSRAVQLARAVAVGLLTPGLMLAISPSTTTLTVNPSGPLAPKAVITLTAVVKSGSESISPGLVLFCNAASAHCEDSALIGWAQLTASGSASIKTRFGIGSHSIRAVFQGTQLFAGSPSLVENLSVNAAANNLSLTVTTIAPSAFGFTFTGTVTGFGQPVPTGTIMFRDTTNGNALLGSAPLGAQGFALTQSSVLPIGVSPQSMTVADFNSDGIPDLVIGDPGSAGVLIALGNGDGTFTLKSTLPDPDAESGVLVADLNSDGIPDVVAGTGIYNTLTVFLGNGDGTFTSGATMPADTFSNGGAPGIASGDFNGDGIPDLVAVASDNNSFTSGAVVILLGKGDGTFTAEPQIATGQSVGVAVADLNGDGFLDLVLFEGDATISVMLGRGDGTFGAESTVTNISGAFSFAVGDLNGDGFPDIVLTEPGSSPNPPNGALTVLLGKGDGTFTIKPPFALPDPSPRIVLTDFNGDGKLDLAATDYDTAGGQLTHYVTFALGNGDGTFSAPTSAAVASQSFPFFAAAGDFNGDGVPDLAAEVLSANDDPSTLNILLGGHTAFAQFQGSSLNLPAGGNEIVSQYSGDGVYSAGASAPADVYISPANTPTFSPAPGIYQWTQSITLKDSTPGASIYYTLDGTTPSASSTLYTAPIEVTWNDTIKALAVAPALGASTIATGVYSIDRPMEAPVFSPASGSYPAPQSVSLTVDPSYCSHAICEIYYTLNGATPTTASVLYTNPIPLTSAGTTTIKAIATSHHFVTSAVASATYTLH